MHIQPVKPRLAALSILAITLWLTAGGSAPRTFGATFPETEPNDSKATADTVDLGTATSGTIAGTSAATTDSDYFKISTSYNTPGIYLNTLTLNDGAAFIGSIRGLSQSGGTVSTTSDVLTQSTVSSPATSPPKGLNQFYTFGGPGKTQTVNYKVVATSSGGGSYTSTFSSVKITPATISNSFKAGNIDLSGLANVGTSGVGTNTSVVVYDSNFNVYKDTVPGSATNGLIAKNDSPTGGGNPFNLTRAFTSGTYYVVVGISNLATNDAAASDDSIKGNAVLDYANVVLTTNTFYSGNPANNNTRPADFSISDSFGTTYTSSGQEIASLYALNFYAFTVVPEPATVASGVACVLCAAVVMMRRRRGRPDPVA